MAVEELMSRNVECVDPEITLRSAAQKMRVNNVGTLAVCEKGKLIGIVTDRDIVVRAVSRAMDVTRTRVRDVMSPHPACCSPDQDIRSAAKTMENKLVRRLPVVDEEGRLVGIVSVTDFARAAEGRDLASRVLSVVAGPHV